MKFTLVVVACLAIAGVHAASIQKDKHNINVDNAFLAKQKFLFEIVYLVEKPLQFEEYIKLGNHLVVEKSKYEQYDEFMDNFFDTYKVGGHLPRGEYFSAIHRNHYLSAFGLFKFFYYAKDWETFVQNVAWARINVNEGMFVYALTLAVIHRSDTNGLILPQIYEIFPQMFFNSELVYQAEKFDWDFFNKQIMLEKELKTIYDHEYPDKFYGQTFYQKDFKTWQWWKLMGLEQDWHLEEKTLFRDNIEIFNKNPNYKAVLDEVKAVFYPVDYTRDIEAFNEESKLSYFTEDVGFNAYWYYLNMDYSNVMGKEIDSNKDHHGQWWIHNVQQLLARYYMERLSHGLGEIDELSFDGIYQSGYNPQMIDYNGNGFSYRKNYYEFESSHNFALYNRLANIEHRMNDVIDSGKYVTKDGVTIDLTKPESVEFVGRMLQGHIDIQDRQFFGYWYAFSSLYLAGGEFNDFIVKPNVLFNYETMLRDPITYSIFKKTLEVFYRFSHNLPSYTRDELIVPGVEFKDVQVSQLKTYFDLVDTDIANLMNEKMVFHDGAFVCDKAMLARQARLNHEPFNFTFKVNSNKEQTVVVRTFLAPDFDENHHKIDLFENSENFMELDEFVAKLVVGENVVHRYSFDFDYTVNDTTTYTELYKYLMLAYEGKQEFPLAISQSHCGFPDRLILPHGWVKGMPMKMFFMITQYNADHEQYSTYDHSYTCGIGSGTPHIDNHPFGYPFDRKIGNIYDFYVPNMLVKDVKIYHEEKYGKYYPKKYEHYGTFDYNF